jgi:histidinol phosphatase-like PHP family hydrolase
VFSLDRPVTELLGAGTLREVRGIGPASERIIEEVARTGASSRVEAALAAASSSKQVDISRRRMVRSGFLSWSGVRAALESTMSTDIVSMDGYGGDLQMHTTGSDGSETVAGMAEACRARGWTRMCVTDHSYGLPVARGMSMDQVARQHAEIDRVNDLHAGTFRVLKGIEANILADGRVDMEDEELRRFELVIASPHSVLRKPDDQTARMIAAVMRPGVHILGHPRGRIFNNRAGVQADWPRVFEAAARANVAIEIDGTWDRQDIDADLARLALEAGCVFAIDSDAHAPMELQYVEYGVAHGRLAGIPSNRVINCWDLDRLLDWAAP